MRMTDFTCSWSPSRYLLTLFLWQPTGTNFDLLWRYLLNSHNSWSTFRSPWKSGVYYAFRLSPARLQFFRVCPLRSQTSRHNGLGKSFRAEKRTDRKRNQSGSLEWLNYRTLQPVQLCCLPSLYFIGWFLTMTENTKDAIIAIVMGILGFAGWLYLCLCFHNMTGV